jgi:type III pantothenate kinase
MTPDVVVDVGNTRIKWGRCRAGKIADVASLPPDAPVDWEKQVRTWALPPASSWVLTGVHPARRDSLKDWLQARGERVTVFKDASCLPLHVALDNPGHVGIDRLLNAVAALQHRATNQPVAIVDVGSAVTVDWVDAAGAFRGGAIVPGFRLMAEALHSYTALLPLIEIKNPEPPLPATNTLSAMEAGIFWTLVGGVQLLIDRMARREQLEPCVFLTGGDSPRLSPFIGRAHKVWKEMTLEGALLTAQATS